MLQRTLLLKVMLIALGMSALLGVAAIFSPSVLQAQKLTVSSMLLVVACGLLLPTSSTGPRKGFTPLQLVWGLYLVIGSLLSLAWIWSWSKSNNFQAFSTGWFSIGIPAMMIAAVPLKRRSDTLDRSCVLAENIVMVAVSAAFVVGMVMLMQLWNQPQLPFVPHCFSVISGGGVIAGSCAVAFRSAQGANQTTRLDRKVAVLGLICTCLAVVMWLLWGVHEFDPFGVFAASATLGSKDLAIATGLSTLAVTIGIWTLLGIAPFHGYAAYLRHFTTVFTLVLGCIVTATAAQVLLFDFIVMRVVGALVVVNGSALLAAGVMLRLSKTSRMLVNNASMIKIMELKCPRCLTARRATCGESTCAQCGLTMLLQFRDDNCPACQYNLRGNTAAQCPECGRLRQMPMQIVGA